jgi:hypothetical protein
MEAAHYVLQNMPNGTKHCTATASNHMGLSSVYERHTLVSLAHKTHTAQCILRTEYDRVPARRATSKAYYNSHTI